MKQTVMMKASDGQNVDEIDIFGTIGEDWWGEGTSASSVLDAIRASKAKTLRININSGGGSIFEGMAMYDAIKGIDAKTTARVIGFSGSMATIVMLAADTVEIVDGSLVMIHNPSNMAQGEAKDLRKAADVLDKLRAGMVRIYSTKMDGMEADDVIAMLDEETWLDAEEARSLGLVDKIVGEDDEAKAALVSLDLMATAPSAKIPLRFAASLGGSVSPSAKRGKMDAIDPEEDGPVATTPEVKEALGLEADATDEEVLEAVQALSADSDDDEGEDEDASDAADDDEEEDDDKGDDDEGEDAKATAPDGFSLIDDDVLADLRQRAAKGDEPEDATAAHEAIVTKAIAEGRIPAAKREKYTASLAADFDTFHALLANDEKDGGLAKGLIPLAELGTSHDKSSGDASGSPVDYDASLFPQLKSNPATIIETE